MKEKGASSEFVIRVLPCISNEVFPLAKLGPQRSNVRSATPPGFKWERDDGDFNVEWAAQFISSIVLGCRWVGCGHPPLQ